MTTISLPTRTHAKTKPSSWELLPLGELTDNFDSLRVPVKEADRRKGPYPYYGASGIVDYVDGFLFDGEYLLIAEDGENLRTRTTPIAFMASGKFWVNNHAHIVRGNSKADTRYLMYALWHANIGGYLTGSTMPKLTQGNLNKIPIPTPPLPDQRAIAHILGTLDDKIELNRQLNHTLEAIARAIFKSWFVDFDPVWAKMEGRPYPLDPDTLALFPDTFEDSELGDIPAGWRVGTLGQIAANPRHTVNPGDVTLDTPYIGLEHMPQGSITLDAWDTAEKVNSTKYRFNRDDILFGKLRPYFHKVGIAPISGICSTDVLVITPREPQVWYGFALGHFSSKTFVDTVTAMSSGTRMPRTNWKDMSSYVVPLPPPELARRYTALIAPMLDTIKNNIFLTETLADLRDTLLPKLISGELRVPAAAEIVEEVAS